MKNYTEIQIHLNKVYKDKKVEELIEMLQVILKGLDIEAVIIVGEEDAS